MGPSTDASDVSVLVSPYTEVTPEIVTLVFGGDDGPELSSRSEAHASPWVRHFDLRYATNSPHELMLQVEASGDFEGHQLFVWPTGPPAVEEIANAGSAGTASPILRFTEPGTQTLVVGVRQVVAGFHVVVGLRPGSCNDDRSYDDCDYRGERGDDHEFVLRLWLGGTPATAEQGPRLR
jgi:hypothetical protein